MSYFRSYFEKNNTIIKNSQANTAKNPTTEIFYGSAFSKFLFKVDFTDLKNKVKNDELVIDSNTRHTLHLTNTIFHPVHNRTSPIHFSQVSTIPPTFQANIT